MGAIQSSINLGKSDRNQQSNLHGRFNNYKNLIKVAKFISNSPFGVAVDELFVCKVFNFISMQNMQIIQPASLGGSQINDLLIFDNLQRFAIVSKRMIFFDVYGVHQISKGKRTR